MKLMKRFRVALVKYERPVDSVHHASRLSDGLLPLTPDARVFIKPNIVFWTQHAPFPKWGVITTSRVLEDIIILLKEKGIRDIRIGEGTVVVNPDDKKV